MKIKVEIEFTEEEQEVLTLLDNLHESLMQANRAGLDEFRFLAYQEGLYGKIEDLFLETAEALLGYDMAKAMRELTLDTGESPSQVVKNQAQYLVEKRGIYA